MMNQAMYPANTPADSASQPAGHPAQPPPAFAVAPADKDLTLRITKLSEYYARSGPAFEELLRTKQKNNPEYAFLFGGEGSSFYAWCRFCMQKGLPYDRPIADSRLLSNTANAPLATQGILQHGGAAVHQLGQIPAQYAVPPAVPQPLPAEVSTGFAQVLAMLQGSQESIKQSSSWFLACSLHAAGMAAMMVQHMQQLPDFTRQLHVIYLVNDILFSSGGPGSEQSDSRIVEVFRPQLPVMFPIAYRASGCTPDAFGQLSRLLDLWQERGMYDAPCIDAVKRHMATAAPSVGQHPAVHPAAPCTIPQAGFQHMVPQYPAGPPQWGPPPGQGAFAASVPGGPWQPAQAGPPTHAPPPGPLGSVSPHAALKTDGWSGGDGPAGVRQQPPQPQLQPQQPQQPAVPEKEPYDIMSFPAGLIPKLCNENLKYEAPYTPLDPRDIDSEPPPRLPVRDAYLQSRLDRFYAEVAEYHPGEGRAQYESKRMYAVQEYQRDEREHTTSGPQVMGDTNMMNDGTYTGGPAFEHGGLGSHQAMSKDPYTAYRMQKSGRYHDVMHSKSTNPNRPRWGH